MEWELKCIPECYALNLIWMESPIPPPNKWYLVLPGKANGL